MYRKRSTTRADFAAWYPSARLTGGFTRVKHSAFTNAAAFTLIELLVVIAIIALLAAILFPVFARAREKARETTCVSNLRQIGMAVRMYVSDADETFPIFHAYNFSPAPGTPGHRGVESELEPYTKSAAVFHCPDDSGGPGSRSDLPASESYAGAYGSSYRFMAACFTVVFGADGSYQNNAPIDTTAYKEKTVADADYVYPSETRIMRDEMFPFFDPTHDPDGAKYGYTPGYYEQWHPNGGGMVFADGHAKFIVSEGAFQRTRATPDGKDYLNNGCWYGCE